MKEKRVLLVGCGDIGIALAFALKDKGALVWGLRRNPSNLPDFIHSIAGDVTQPESLSGLKNIGFDYVIITLTPASFCDEDYRQVYVQGAANIILLLEQEQFAGHIFFISSTSVYHQNDGQWIDEQSSACPENFSGCRLLEAEDLFRRSSLSSTVVRFAGIYGPGRRRLIKQVLAAQGCRKEPKIYTNRIHRDDCVGFLAHLMVSHHKNQTVEALYIGVDDSPATLWQVIQWLAVQLGIDVRTMTVSEHNRRTSKRCRNYRMRASGYQLLYPDYQSGYGKLVKNDS